MTTSMLKRPTIRKRGPVEKTPEQSYLAGIAAAAAEPPKKKSLRNLILRHMNKIKKRPKRIYHLSGLQNSLFNADGLADVPNVVKLFRKIAHEKDPRIESASLKGGRFKEMARYNSKGLINLKEGQPNQVGIGFIIDGKKNYVNLFESGAVRFTGASDETKVIQFIEHLVGKVGYIEYSNRSGQVKVDRTINLEKLGESIKGARVVLDKAQLFVQFSFMEEVKVPIVDDRRMKNPTKTVVHLGNKTVYETIQVRKKLFTLGFYKSGIIQYKGKFNDRGLIIRSIYSILDDAGDVFGEIQERPKVDKKVSTYKTRSTNPPDPPDSFEGKCKHGYYCRPNAQGFPTCYKIPRITESSRKTVIEAYKGIPIPKSVKELFKIEEVKEVEKLVEIKFEKQEYKGKILDVLKIGGRQCARLTEDQLEDVARKHGIPGVRRGMGIAKMCGLIGASIKPKANRANFELEGIKYYVQGEHIKGALRKNGKPNPGRKCATIPTETLYKYARAMGIDPTGKSKPQICKEMQAKKQPERVVLVEQPKEVQAPPPVINTNEQLYELEGDYRKQYEYLFSDQHVYENQPVITDEEKKIKAVGKFWLGIDIVFTAYPKDMIKKLVRKDDPDVERLAKGIVLAEHIIKLYS